MDMYCTYLVTEIVFKKVGNEKWFLTIIGLSVYHVINILECYYLKIWHGLIVLIKHPFRQTDSLWNYKIAILLQPLPQDLFYSKVSLILLYGPGVYGVCKYQEIEVVH